jgi:hypothetical protein
MNAVDLSMPHWKCRCGKVAMPLTDDTECYCGDIYEQDWNRINPMDQKAAGAAMTYKIGDLISGQALLADRDLRITCYECFKKLRPDEYRIEFAQSAARVFAELAATTANPRRKHGAD